MFLPLMEYHAWVIRDLSIRFYFFKLKTLEKRDYFIQNTLSLIIKILHVQNSLNSGAQAVIILALSKALEKRISILFYLKKRI